MPTPLTGAQLIAEADLKIIPADDDGQATVTSGQAYTIAGATLLGDESGWSFTDVLENGLRVQGMMNLLRGATGFTLAFSVLPGTRNNARRSTLWALEIIAITNAGGWVRSPVGFLEFLIKFDRPNVDFVMQPEPPGA